MENIDDTTLENEEETEEENEMKEEETSTEDGVSEDGGEEKDPTEEVAEVAMEMTNQILNYFPRIEQPVVNCTLDEGTVWIEMEGDPTGRLIGRKGQTIDAFEHILSKMVSHKLRRKVSIHVDAEGYKKRYRIQLEEIANETAAYVADTGEARALESMSAADRRIVHITLRNNSDVITASEGRDPDRFVVIWPDDDEDDEE
jgi:spoIIIJ-associated protein